MNTVCNQGVCALVDEPASASIEGVWQAAAQAESFDSCYDQELDQKLVITGLRNRFYLSLGGHGPVPVSIQENGQRAVSQIDAKIKCELAGKVATKIQNSFSFKLLPGGSRLSGSWKQVLQFANGEQVSVTYQIRGTRLSA